MATMTTTTIAALSDIPPLVKAFATTLGFTVGGSSSSPTVQAPGGGMTFQMDVVTGFYPSFFTSVAYDAVQWSSASIATSVAQAWSPKLAVGGVFNSILPTKLILIGSLTPQPYIAAIICYGFNLYRHLYLGVMEGIGNYTGGEIICGSRFSDMAFTSSPWLGDYTQYLFGAFQAVADATRCGGVHIVHADNPTYPWRVFSRFPIANNFAMPEACVVGGFGDQANDAYVGIGENTFASVKVLTPINLYAGRTGDNMSAIGRPPGVRLISLDGVDPESTITIGSSQWLVVPQFAKSTLLSVPVNASQQVSGETSGLVGLAYQSN